MIPLYATSVYSHDISKDAHRKSDKQSRDKKYPAIQNSNKQRCSWSCVQRVVIIMSPITISQWNYHHKTHHIYTYSSELILTHIHHCQPTLSTVNRIWWWWAFSLSLPPDEQCHRWNAEIRTNAGAAVLPARANKRTKANKSAFMGWTQSHTHFL